MTQAKFTRLLNHFENTSLETLKLYCIGIATLVGIRVIQIQNGWITDDSVLYFEVARLFSLGEWKAGFVLYNWPFYPALIAWVHQLSGLDIQSSAQCLALLFFGLTVYGFCTLINLCGGDKLAIASGTLILLSSTYIVGDILPMLIRDHGFWAFYMLSLVSFARYYQTGKIRTAIMWQAAIIAAALFRIEAVSFLILLPISLLADGSIDIQKRLTRLFYAYLLVICITILLLLVAFTQSFNTDNFGRLRELISVETYIRLSEVFRSRADLMGDKVLGDFLDKYAEITLLLSLIFIVLAKTFGTSGLVTIILLFQAIKERFLGLSPAGRYVLGWAAGVALLNMFFILTKEFILSGRYVISLSLTLMVIAAISLSNLLGSTSHSSYGYRNRKKVVIALLVILTLGLAANILPVKPGHNYEQDAVSWIKQQTSDTDKVFYVSPRARYFAGEPYRGRGVDYWLQVTNAIADNSIHTYDYLAINISHKNPDRQAALLQQLPDYRLVKIFEGVRGKKKMLIFAKIKNSQ